MAASDVKHNDISNWVIPALLGALFSVLFWIGTNIHEMSKSLAVAVTKIDDHERRIENLETLSR